MGDSFYTRHQTPHGPAVRRLSHATNGDSNPQRATIGELRSFVRLSSAVIGYFDFPTGISLTLPTTRFVHAVYSTPSVCLEASVALAQSHGASSLAPILGQPLSTLFPPEQRWEEVLAEWHQRGFSPHGFEMELRSRHGAPWRARCVLYARTIRGRLRRLWVIARDISDYAHAVKTISTLREHYRSMLNAPDTICARILPDASCEYLSPSTIALLGLHRDSGLLRRARVADFVHPDDCKLVSSVFSRPHDDSLSGALPIRCRLRHGEFALFQARFHPVVEANGAVTSCDIIATRLEHAPPPLGETPPTTHPAVELPQIAHDVNNLLTIALAHLHSASGSTTENPRLDAPIQALTEAMRLAQQLTCLHSEHHTPRNESTHLPSLLERLPALMRPVVPVGISLIVSPVIPDLAVAGSSTAYLQILTNLILNAIEALGAHGSITISAEIERRSITSETDPTPRAVRISVLDNGPGIPEEIKEDLFTPHRSTKSDDKPRGLGLASVRRMVSNIGGELDVESSATTGTTFTVRAPIMLSTPIHSQPQTHRMCQRPLHVLVADDEPAIRSLFESLISSLGHNIRAFSGANDLIKHLSLGDTKVDVVVVDDQMPGSTASALCETVRSFDPNVALVVSSGDPLAATRVNRELGNLYFLPKPFLSTDLQDVFEAVVAGNGLTGSVVAKASG